VSSRSFVGTVAAVAAVGAALYAVRAAPPKPQQQASGFKSPAVAAPQKDDTSPTPRVTLPESEWKKRLDPMAFYVTREEGTERAGTHPYAEWHQDGVFRCVGCGLELFSSKTKFESGTGWPSFWAPIQKDRVTEKQDTSLGMVRVEVECARCGGHLGHVFDDGPKPTGLRYCMNGAALTFKPAAAAAKAVKK
jgi:peptide-methionine (R)-S-oxide reductase